MKSRLNKSGHPYPGYASPISVENEITVPAPKGKVLSVTDSFTNVPAGNNEWALFYVYAVAPDGSKYFLGDLATMVNVASGAAQTVKASVQSTLVWQAELAMIEAGQFAAGDLKAHPTLGASVAAEIAAQGMKPQKSTGLFSTQQLAQFVQTWMPAWERKVSVTVDPHDEYLTIAGSAKSIADETLFYNSAFSALTGSGALEDLRPYGAPCDYQVVYGIPGSKVRMGGVSCATYWEGPLANGGSSFLLPVYGAPLLIGQVSYLGPYAATLQKIPAPPAASTVTLALGTLQPAARNLTLDDPADWAFGNYPELYEAPEPNAPFTFPSVDEFFDWAVPYGWSQANPAISVVAWNPWGLPLAALQICTWNHVCQAASSDAILHVTPPFEDFGNALSYFNWTIGSGGTSIAAGPPGCPGYRSTFTGSAFTISSHTPTLLQANQQLQFFFDGAPCNPDPSGTQVTVTATGTDGATYVNWGKNYGPAGSVVNVYMASVPRDTSIASISITFSGLSGTALDLASIDARNIDVTNLEFAGRPLAGPHVRSEPNSSR
jgi:hypothetical protein